MRNEILKIRREDFEEAFKEFTQSEVKIASHRHNFELTQKEYTGGAGIVKHK